MIFKIRSYRDNNGAVVTDYNTNKSENMENLKLIFQMGIPEEIKIINAENDYVMQKLSDAYVRIIKDMKDMQSDLYQKVYRPLTGAGIGDCEKWMNFAEGMLEKLIDSQITPYINREGKTFAGLKRINGKLIYFKFALTEEELAKSIGEGEADMAMNVPHVENYLYMLNPQTLADYVAPDYYYQMGYFEKDYENEEELHNWLDFEFSLD